MKKKFAQFLDRVKPDTVCLGTLHSTYWLAPEARSRRLPVIYYTHGEEISGVRPSRLEGDGPKNALLRADAVITVSEFTKSKLRDLGVKSDRIHLITNGVEIDRFSPGPKDPALIAKYGLAGKRVLLTFGRLDQRKGQDQVLRALPSILQAVPDLVYIIAGSGPFELPLRGLAEELGIVNRVVFTGYVSEEDASAHYRLADLFIMANRTMPDGDTEGFGIVFLEAGACGIPVIGGFDGGAPSAILNGETGVLVDGRSAEAISSAVIRLFSDPTRLRRLGSLGRRHALTQGWSTKANQFESLLIDLPHRMQVGRPAQSDC